MAVQLLEWPDGDLWRRLAACLPRLRWMPAHQDAPGGGVKEADTAAAPACLPEAPRGVLVELAGGARHHRAGGDNGTGGRVWADPPQDRAAAQVYPNAPVRAPAGWRPDSRGEHMAVHKFHPVCGDLPPAGAKRWLWACGCCGPTASGR